MRTYLIQEVSFPGRTMSHSSWVESSLSKGIGVGAERAPWMDYRKGHSEKQHAQDRWGGTSNAQFWDFTDLSTGVIWSPLPFSFKVR